MTDDDSRAHNVLLGYLEVPEAPHLLHRRFFPSKVGGKPAWLDPDHLPDLDTQLRCRACNVPLTFLLQIYASRDTPPTAFHRTIYLFCCTTCGEEFIALRCQLPRENAYYPSFPADPSQDTDLEDACLQTSCCQKCGLPLAPETLPGSAHKHCLQTCERDTSPCMFAEHLLDIEETNDDDDDDADSESQSSDEQTDRSSVHNETFDNEKRLVEQYAREEVENPEGCLDISEQEVFSALQEGREDPHSDRFLSYMRRYPNHVVRYGLGATPLWFSSKHLPNVEHEVLPCSNCGSKRQFEFQIQPNLIYELSADRLNFAVLCIYTCAESCHAQASGRYSTYLPESVVKQIEQFPSVA